MKRAFDCMLALAALVVLLPLLVGVAGLVRVTLGSPILFAQKRPGRHGQIFTLWKFRTMSDARDAMGKLRGDRERLGRFGRWLRATSIDELPELWNIVRGDMSFVGPRPLLVEYLPLYSREQARRHEVRPGLTGWAQVHGRNAVDWDERFRLDVWYVENRSFAIDLLILARTAWLVIRREGVTATGEATMRPFTGAAQSR